MSETAGVPTESNHRLLLTRRGSEIIDWGVNPIVPLDHPDEQADATTGRFR